MADVAERAARAQRASRRRGEARARATRDRAAALRAAAAAAQQQGGMGPSALSGAPAGPPGAADPAGMGMTPPVGDALAAQVNRRNTPTGRGGA